MIRFGAVSTEADIVYTNGSCKLKINNGSDERGELLLTNSEICWKSGPETGFMIPWDKVTVQAITQEPQRSVYFMIDASWPTVAPNNGANGDHAENEDQNGSEDEGHESDGSVQELTEFHIIPDRSEDIDEIYYIMTKFPVADDMDEDSDDDFFDGENNIDQMNLNDDDERFADAE